MSNVMFNTSCKYLTKKKHDKVQHKKNKKRKRKSFYFAKKFRKVKREREATALPKRSINLIKMQTSF